VGPGGPKWIAPVALATSFICPFPALGSSHPIMSFPRSDFMRKYYLSTTERWKLVKGPKHGKKVWKEVSLHQSFVRLQQYFVRQSDSAQQQWIVW
jgi:hypothetical protein